MSYDKHTSVSNSLTSEILKKLLPVTPYALVYGEGNNDNATNGHVYVLCYAEVKDELYAEVRIKNSDCDFDDRIKAEPVKPGKRVAYDRELDSSDDLGAEKKLQRATLAPLQQAFTLKNLSRPADKSTHLVVTRAEAEELLKDFTEYEGSSWEIREISLDDVMQNVLDTKFRGILLS